MRFAVIKKKSLILGVAAVISLALVFTAVWSTGAYVVQAGKSPGKLPVYCVDREDGKVAITFDASWGAERTDGIVNTVLEHKGENLIPKLKKLVEENQEIYDKEQVRNEMFLKLGYYVTESSGHNSEYNAWFRKRPDLIEKYCTHGTNWNPGEHAYSLNLRKDRRENPNILLDEWLEKEIDLNRSDEYAGEIFNARIGDGRPFVFNGNVINNGSIPNLPDDACVEVPVVADKMGFKTTIAGPLPEHLAILVNTTARIENLVVEAAMKKSKELVYQAVYMDPLSSAVCSMDEIKNMCDELFEVNKEFLGDYK